ncbi:hypothetical protein [Vampirovibrio sp.]|uniref:hypothetical protein n=1 Tax=Vampirovibrio sp. TaxID=2717857 RepID=UPI00359483C3
MSSPESTQNASTPKNNVSSLGELATLDHFLRLQQSQAEYLAWLEANEQTAGLDGYMYRQIR